MLKKYFKKRTLIFGEEVASSMRDSSGRREFW
jgi:hypothetical protein